MNELDLIIDFHLEAQRQGPGSNKQTLEAFNLTRLEQHAPLKIADIGCGTGAQTIALAQNCKAHITAVDLFSPFLDKLNTQVNTLKLNERISTIQCSMEELPFESDDFDVIWSEGAIYNMGFKNGIKYWKNFIKPSGYLVVSEISWTTDSRPNEIEHYWSNAYPDIDTIANKIQQLGAQGYSPEAHFVLPESCWLDNYYKPMQDRFSAFLERHDNSAMARSFVENEQKEIENYQKYKEYFNYSFYIAKKIG